MEAPKGIEEENAKKFDFTKAELEYIIENANFTEEQEEIFKMLTGRQRQTVDSKHIN